jgi:hypothetical protein
MDIYIEDQSGFWKRAVACKSADRTKHTNGTCFVDMESHFKSEVERETDMSDATQ